MARNQTSRQAVSVNESRPTVLMEQELNSQAVEMLHDMERTPGHLAGSTGHVYMNMAGATACQAACLANQTHPLPGT
jgi:hypothetical protein